MLSLCEPEIDHSAVQQYFAGVAKTTAIFLMRYSRPFFAIFASNLALIGLFLVKSTVVFD